jgi:4,5-DOPA dioxygenase extradiol
MQVNRQPSLFVSHGAPTFALEPGIVGPRLTELGAALPRPAAVLVVSPHWVTPAPKVGTVSWPGTIHDFGGFDPALYEISYPVAGHPQLAGRAVELLRAAGWHAEADERRGLDHGAWVPLMHLYPQADVPVFQVSLPARIDADAAYALGESLAPLSGKGVLIVGSGSLTHNLYEFRIGHARDEAYAAEFAGWIGEAAVAGDHERLRHALGTAPHARRAHPTPEHFWPLLVAAGAAGAAAEVTILEGGITHGVLAMDAFLFGGVAHPDQGNRRSLSSAASVGGSRP